MRMRILFYLYLLITVLLISGPAGAQQVKKLPRIGYLAGDPKAPSHEAFRQGLRDLGYIEGRNILIEWRFAEDKVDRYSEFASELVRLKADVIVAANSGAVGALKRATQTIPIVMANYGGDPVADGLVASFAKPGGNITGVISLSPELSGKQLELLKETLPKLSRVAVIWNPDDRSGRIQLQEVQTAAGPLEIQVLAVEVRASDELDKAIEVAAHGRVAALMVPRTAFFYLLRKRIVALAEKHRLPGMYPDSQYVKAGGLMSYAADSSDVHRRAVTYVDRILKGAKPGDLPIQQPTKFELVINLRTATALGLRIPPSVLLRADQTIE